MGWVFRLDADPPADVTTRYAGIAATVDVPAGGRAADHGIRYNELTGVLTTEHPASSYAQPVFVPETSLLRDQPVADVYGPADVVTIRVHYRTDLHDEYDKLCTELARQGWPVDRTRPDDLWS